MSSWYELMQRGSQPPEWPYPIRYGRVNQIEADVLVLGGGIAGCHAAISAAKRGMRVVVVEKAAVVRSGNGGAGVDHWQGACTNPCSRVTPDEFAEAAIRAHKGFTCGIARYIKAKEGWDTLLDCEQMGLKIRDVDDDFRGAPFRDEATKLLFAYDYENRHTLRVYGENMKPILHRELKRLGVRVCNRVSVTSLLTEGGRQGGPVVGATGVSVRTGEFYVFSSRATVLAMAGAGRLWLFSSELQGSASDFDSPGNTGDGIAMGWRAGAELALMTGNVNWDANPFRYVPYGVGNTDNTWQGCPIVDARGNEVPWMDRDRRVLTSEEERFRPSHGQRLMLASGIVGDPDYETEWPRLTRELPQALRDGRFTLPLYADLPRMSPHERRALFGLMVGNEGKTRVPVYETYAKAGFNPDTDMLMVPIMPSEMYDDDCFWQGVPLPNVTSLAYGGFLVDWDLKTSLDGLYAAGESVYGAGAHASAAATGRYAGRKAAEWARTPLEAQLDSKQIKEERERVYAAVGRSTTGIGWKEFNAGICRVMQDFCGRQRRTEVLRVGLEVLRQIEESEASRLYASNPHELGCVLECQSLLTVGEVIMRASLSQEASNPKLNFNWCDPSLTEQSEVSSLLPIRFEDGEAAVRNVSLDYYVREPYSDSLEDNYVAHCCISDD